MRTMNIFITGITGTLGTKVTELLLKKGDCKIYGMSRDEFKIKNFKHRNIVKLFVGDIRDVDRVVELTRNIDTIFHFAALKHVDICEQEISEGVKTNLAGTHNIAHAQNINNVTKVVFTSTDKAVLPINIYGHCKAISEKIILANNEKNAVCRYGNVLNSRGSVFGIFKNQILKNKKIEITDYEMTRYWITIKEAAEFVIDTAFNQAGLRIPYTKLSACSVLSIANATLHVLHNRGLVKKEEVTFSEVGMRPGEKIHESIDYFTEGKLQTSKDLPPLEFSEVVKLAESELGL